MNAIATQLGRSVLRRAELVETITVIRTTGARDVTGEWQEIEDAPFDVLGVSLPLTGIERELLPEGLQRTDSRRFILPADTLVAIAPDSAGAFIEWDGERYRAVQVDNWGTDGYQAVTAALPAGTVRP